MIEFGFADYRVVVHLGDHPVVWSHWLEHAAFKDIEGLKDEGHAIFIGVGQGGDWFETVIAFRTRPLDESGFVPGILVVPETEALFVGAGRIMRTYNLRTRRLQFEKEASIGFWGWKRTGDHVIASEELELGVYSLDGKEVWSTFVEPPWGWWVEGDRVKVDVMGTVRYHDLRTGKEIS